MNIATEAPTCNCGMTMHRCATGSADCWHCDCGGHHLCSSDRGTVATCPACVTAIRAKIAALTCRCSPDCPGWAVFETGTKPDLEVCDHCWIGVPDRLDDSDINLLPEAQNELALAVKDGAAWVGWDPPDSGPPCACGCVIYRFVGVGRVKCCGCSELRDAPPAPVADEDMFKLAREIIARSHSETECNTPDDAVALAKLVLGPRVEEMCRVCGRDDKRQCGARCREASDAAE